MRRKSSDSVKIYYPKHSREDIIKILHRKVPLLRREIPVKKIVLFGSYAKNRYTVASDVDIFILYLESKDKGYDVYKVFWDIIDIPNVQLHIYTMDQYQKLKKTHNPFIKTVEEEGIVIWEDKNT